MRKEAQTHPSALNQAPAVLLRAGEGPGELLIPLEDSHPPFPSRYCCLGRTPPVPPGMSNPAFSFSFPSKATSFTGASASVGGRGGKSNSMEKGWDNK